GAAARRVEEEPAARRVVLALLHAAERRGGQELDGRSENRPEDAVRGRGLPGEAVLRRDEAGTAECLGVGAVRPRKRVRGRVAAGGDGAEDDVQVTAHRERAVEVLAGRVPGGLEAGE